MEIMNTELTILISSIAGFLLSIAFAYIPKLKEWYKAQDSTKKAFVMMISLIIVSVGIFTFSCLEMFNLAVTCGKEGIETLFIAFFAALAANQPSYALFVKPFESKK
jgi:uncharacterized protein with PQ loop repeat